MKLVDIIKFILSAIVITYGIIVVLVFAGFFDWLVTLL